MEAGKNCNFLSKFSFHFLPYLRTLLLPIRYRTIVDATNICKAIGADLLEPFSDFGKYEKLYKQYMANPGMTGYCDHGGRYMLWLPYTGWTDLDDGTPNVTYFMTSEPLLMNEAWRKDNPRSIEKPYCVIARMGMSKNNLN